MKTFDELLAEEEAAEKSAKEKSSGDYLEPTRGRVSGEELTKMIAEVANTPPKRREMPGDTPRVAAPNAPGRREIALDAARSAAEHAETAEEKATRQFNATVAGAKDAVPFYARLSGAAAAVPNALSELALKATPSYNRPTDVLGAAKEGYETEFARVREQIAKDKAGSPVHAAMGSAPLLAASGVVGAGRGLAGRLTGSTLVGGVYGASAVDRPGVSLGEMAAGTGVGAGLGLGAGLAGEALRPIVRGSPGREDKAFVREIARTEGGEGGSGLLARNTTGIARDYENVIAQRHRPAIREAAKLSEGKGVPAVEREIKPFADDNTDLYKRLEKAAVTGPYKGRAEQMTAKRLFDLLEESKGNVSAGAADRLSGVQKDLLTHAVPNQWKGEEVMPVQRFRKWLSEVQDSANRVPGSLNATQAWGEVQEVQREATRIFNSYLDSIGDPAAVAAVRANNEQISSLSRIKDAMIAKAGKEKLQKMGLGKVLEEHQKSLERSAALWSAMEGKPIAAAMLVAKPYVASGAAKGARWLNQYVLEPLQIAAEQGSTRAQLVRFAVERGLPQASAMYVVDGLGLAKKAAGMAKTEKKAAAAEPRRMPPIDLDRIGGLR